jgi:hypothetical protein
MTHKHHIPCANSAVWVRLFSACLLIRLSLYSCHREHVDSSQSWITMAPRLLRNTIFKGNDNQLQIPMHSIISTSTAKAKSLSWRDIGERRYNGVEPQLHGYLTLAPDKWVSFTPWPLYPGRRFWYGFDRTLSGSQSRSARCGEGETWLWLESDPNSFVVQSTT